MNVEIVGNVPETEWKLFLEDESEATIYHTPEWKRFLEGTFGYSSRYLFATDECGELRGLLPLFHMKSRLTGSRLCSVPFAHECGILGDQNGRTALINEALELGQRSGADVLEVRGPVENDSFTQANNFDSFILDFPTEPADIFTILCKRKTRAMIKKTEAYGVEVTTSSAKEDLKEFYELNRMTKQKLGVPCHPRKFFENLFSTLEGHVHLYLARQNGEIIAGGVMESYKNQFLAGYAAADPATYHLYPNYALFWKSITDAYENGYRTYDFGRVHKGNAGLRRFKSNWKTREKALWYSTYPSSKLPFSGRDTGIYRLSNTVIRRLPTPVYTKFSEMVFPHFG
ncbi:MAG: GNAT family N-acetyltransferase [Methanospirillum sp.]